MSSRSGTLVAESAKEPVAVLDVRSLSVHFQLRGTGLLGLGTRPVVRAVDDVSFRVEGGETLGLVGESGCGKTSVAKALVGLVPATAGQVVIQGRDVARLSSRDWRPVRRQIQMVFQDPFSSLNPRRTAEEIIREPLDIHRVGTSRERRARVSELLSLVGLNASHARRLPHQFSGGQRQRIGIARALALHPDILVADEPISALDVSIQAQITNLLQDLQEQLGLAYLYIAHDLAVVRHISRRVAVMYLGRIVETGPTDQLFDQPRHPYTSALLSAVPVPDPALEASRRRLILRGEVPSPINRISGCRFKSRCWLREKLGNPTLCDTDEPQLVDVPGTTQHRVACHFADDARPPE